MEQQHKWTVNPPFTFRREVLRKIVHLFGLVYILIFWYFARSGNSSKGILVLTSFLVMALLLEQCRIEKPTIPVLRSIWRVLKRPSEYRRLGAEAFLLLGVIIAFSAFDIRAATAAIGMELFGDASAALMLYAQGRKIYRYRTLKASVVEWIVNVIIGWFFLRTSAWWITGDFGAPLLIPIFITATTAVLVETFTYDIDDNLAVPILAGLAAHVALMIY